MATPVLNKISKDLSYKIFDPVSSGADDGHTFSRELRLAYINRAYGKLIRTLEIIHPKITKVFKDYYKFIELSETDTGTFPLEQGYDVFQVYYKTEEDNGPYKANYLDPANYMTAKLGINSFYEPTQTDRYWTIIDNSVMLLPNNVEYLDVTAFCRSNFPGFEYEGSTDIKIPGDYEDLLITMAALEAMSDKGEVTKYELYTRTLTAQLALIAESKRMESIKEEGIA